MIEYSIQRNDKSAGIEQVEALFINDFSVTNE